MAKIDEAIPHDINTRRFSVLADVGSNLVGVTSNTLDTNADLNAGTEIVGKVYVTDGTDDAAVVAAADDSTNLEDANGLVVNAILNGRISNSAIRPIRIDGSTNSLQTITYPHHEIHAGSSFVVCDLQNVDTTAIKWQITTPDSTKYAHMFFDIDCTGEMTILVTEGSDRTDGTALAEINRNRVGTPTAATVVVTRTPTGGTTDGATTILNKRSGFTNIPGKTVSGGATRGLNEYVLKPSTKYIVSITTYADVWVSFCIDWYEHTDRN